MRLSILRPRGLLYYRACVALRQILKAGKKPGVRRVRKAAAIAVLCLLATRERASLGDEIQPRDSNPPSERRFHEIDSDGIRPIRLITASIAPFEGELPANLAAQRFAETSDMNVAASGGRGWATYAYFWQAPAVGDRPRCFAAPSRLNACRFACGRARP